MKIIPTVGRVVWYWPDGSFLHVSTTKPHAALIVHVVSDEAVNLVIFDENGMSYTRRLVILRQDEDENAPRPAYAHATWMPYQIAAAAKTPA